jgi:hypothetical protein
MQLVISSVAMLVDFPFLPHGRRLSKTFILREKTPETTNCGHQQWRPSTPTPQKEPPSYKPKGTMAGCPTLSSTEEPPHSRPSYSGTRPPHFSPPQSPTADRVQSSNSLCCRPVTCLTKKNAQMIKVRV